MSSSWLSRLTMKHIGIGVAAITFAIYAPFLGNHFVSIDDNYLIYDNAAIRSITPETIKHIFTTYDPQLYIPLTFFTYQLDYLIAGNSPWIFHLTNLLFHIANTMLVLWIIDKLTGKRFVAAACALLFAIHPLNVEAVLWAAARKDVQASFFFLLSIAMYMRYQERPTGRQFWICVLFFLLALLSKVSVIMLPFILLLIDWKERRTIDPRMLKEKWPYFLLSAFFGVIAIAGKARQLQSVDRLFGIFIPAKSTLFYLLKIAIPTHLSVIYPQSYALDPLSLAFLATILGFCALIGLAVFLVARRPSSMIGFGLAWFLLLLVPSFSTYWKNGFLFFASDRYAYMASVGIFLIAALLIEKIGKRLNVAVAAIAAVVLIPLTVVQARTWRETEALYRNALANYPSSVMAHDNLGLALDQKGLTDEAAAEYRKAIDIAPENSVAYFNLAANLGKGGDVSGAIALYEKILQTFEARELVSESDIERFTWLAKKFDELGKPGDSLALLEKLVRLAPSFASTHEALGLKYHDLGRENDALKEWEKAEQLGSQNVEMYYHMAEAYSNLNRTSDVIRVLKEGVALDPGNQNAKAELNRLESGR